MNARLIAVFLNILFVSVASSQTTSKPMIKDVIAGFEKAVLAKDTSLLSGITAENFAVSTSTWPSSARLLQRVWSRPQQIESIQLLSGESVSLGQGKQKVRASIKETGKEPVETNVILNNNNQILYIDYFDQLFGRDRYQKSRLCAQIPIEILESGSIVLTLQLNDNPRKLRFLFDSAADGMAISKTLADTLGLKIGHSQSTSVVGGNMNVSISTGNTVSLDTLRLENQNIALFDRTHPGLDGVIGITLAKSYITYFNLDQKRLSLYSFGDYNYEEAGETIEMTLPGNIPIIPASLDLTGKGYINGHFAFDTGAGYHLIGFSTFVRQNQLLTGGFKPESQSTTVSMGKSSPTFNGKCVDFKVNSIHIKEMPVTLQGGSSWDAGADGSIGIKFTSQFNFTIDLLEKEIHFTPRNN